MFDVALAQPPRMWMTHPPNREREDNAKRRYVEAHLDDREAWCLFRDPDGLRRRMTIELSRLLSEGGELPAPDPALTRQVIVEQYGHVALDPRFMGVYLQEPAVLSVDSPKDLLSHPVAPSELQGALSSLYPDSLREECERIDSLRKEEAMLDAFQHGHLDAPGGALSYRGQELKRGKVGPVLRSVETEIAEAKLRIVAQQNRTHSTFLALARHFGNGWGEYLTSLVQVWHYYCHCLADLSDALHHWSNSLAVAMADGKLSAGERKRLVQAGQELHTALLNIHSNRAQVTMTERMASELEVESWNVLLGPLYDRDAPSKDNLQEFVEQATRCADIAVALLSVAQRFVLIELLTAEGYLLRQFERDEVPAAAPQPAQVPATYSTMAPEKRRKIQKRLGFRDRFHAGLGFWPRMLRFAMASVVMVALLGVTVSQQEAEVSLYNGLNARVTVQLGGEPAVVLEPFETRSVHVPALEQLHIQSRISGDIVEELSVSSENFLSHYVYNVAAAAPLEEWVAHYGKEGSNEPEHTRWHTQTWFATDADYVLRAPPRTLKTRRGRATSRSVLSAAGRSLTPVQILSVVPEQQRAAVIAVHLRFDEAGSTRQAWGRAAQSEDRQSGEGQDAEGTAVGP